VGLALMPIFWSKATPMLQHRRLRFSPALLVRVYGVGEVKPALRSQAGFTLLELLVALVIISIMTAVVGFSVSGSNQRTLKGEGDKLAARLNAAQAQMSAGASPLRLITTDAGYAFETTERADDGTAKASWKRLEGDDVLAARALPTGAMLVLKEPLLIAREPITAPMRFQLEQAELRVVIATDGVQGWAVQ
jgi:type II secretion system protein H